MTKNRQFVALGPNDGFSAEGLTGFFTSATSLAFGVNAQGGICGVYGESNGIGAGADRMPPPEVANMGICTGVCGSGLTYGVYGLGGQIAGVWGEVPSPLGTGVIGRGGKTATGVLGASDDYGLDPNTHPFTSGIGVQGLSSCGSGFGVQGVSIKRFGATTTPTGTPMDGSGLDSNVPNGSGTGVWGASGSGTGVQGTSSSGRGGIFKSESAAQLELTPITSFQSPPKEGRAGDLLTLMGGLPTPSDHPVREMAELWFCIKGSTATSHAIWGKVEFSQIQQ
jgi:hypothetical protein